MCLEFGENKQITSCERRRGNTLFKHAVPCKDFVAPAVDKFLRYYIRRGSTFITTFRTSLFVPYVGGIN
jgi:hypothetical protein